MFQSDLLSLSSKEEELLKIREVLSAETGLDLADPEARVKAWQMYIDSSNELSALALRDFPMASNIGDAFRLLQANNPNLYYNSLRKVKAAEGLYYALATGMIWANYPEAEMPSPLDNPKEYYLGLSDSLSLYNKMLKMWEEYKELLPPPSSNSTT